MTHKRVPMPEPVTRLQTWPKPILSRQVERPLPPDEDPSDDEEDAEPDDESGASPRKPRKK